MDLLPSLSNYAKCNYGIVSGNDDIFIITISDIEKYKLERECLLPLIRAQNCYKYGYSDYDNYIVYPYKVLEGNTMLLKEEEFKNLYPNTYQYLFSNKEVLEKRKDSRTTFENSENWYSLTRFGRLQTFLEDEKITTGARLRSH